jgi:alcohol dehydrogenase
LLAPGTGIVRLPDELPDRVACPSNCATATVAAALRTASGCREQTVLVQGAGLLGLTACAMARANGARTVLCCDLDEQRLERASRFGADRACLAEPTALADVVRQTTAGRGVDLALELSGSAAAVEAGLGLLRIGGRHVWVGTVAPTRPVALDPETVVRRQLTIHGVHNYAPEDLADAVTFLAREHGRYPFGELVAEVFPLEQAAEAFRRAQDVSIVRVGISPPA